MKEDIEISAARRPPGGGWWVDGRCGAVMFAALSGSVLFSVAFAFRNGAEAAVQAPVFVSVVTVLRVVSYIWLGCILTPLDWALRHTAYNLATVLLLDLVLLAYSYGLLGSSILVGSQGFASTGLRTCAFASAAVVSFATMRALSRTFKAGVQTTKLYGRSASGSDANPR